jgi:hypothetical protein
MPWFVLGMHPDQPPPAIGGIVEKTPYPTREAAEGAARAPGRPPGYVWTVLEAVSSEALVRERIAPRIRQLQEELGL